MITYIMKFATIAAIVALISVSVVQCSGTDNKNDYTRMSPEALAEHLLFESGSFKLDQATPGRRCSSPTSGSR